MNDIPEGDVAWLPELYKNRANSSTVQIWRIGVCKLNNRELLVTRSGILNKGKATQHVKEVKKVGLSLADNATAKCQKKWQDRQSKEGWGLTQPSCTVANASEGTSGPSFFSPMLAKPLTKNKKGCPSMSFPCLVQPKLDGLRCFAIADGKGIQLYSRNNIAFKGLPEIKKALEAVMLKFKSGLYLDGELWTPDMPFEQLSGMLRRAQHHCIDVPHVQFHIFDCYNTKEPTMPFSGRHAFLTKLCEEAPSPHLSLVQTSNANAWDDMLNFHAKFQVDGYEGLIARNPHAPYSPSTRSAALQKYKQFQDDEFDIVGYEEAEGQDSGTVIWVCATKNGTKFHVRPRGTRAERASAFKNAASTVQARQRLTVIYQELSANGVPRFPVGKGIRTDL